MPAERTGISEDVQDRSVGWKLFLAKAAIKVPKTFSEFLWKSSLIFLGVTATLSGALLWRNPGIILGRPVEEQSLMRRLSAHQDGKKKIFELMERFYYMNRPDGLMLVAWEELDSLVGVWVRPADRFIAKAGEHALTPDFRALGGHFLFGECAATESLAMEGKILVACPINTSYDVWGYVGAVVEPSKVEEALPLVHLLTHRITHIIY